MVRIGVRQWFKRSRSLFDCSGNRCRVRWVNSAMCAVVDDGSVGSPNKKHMNCRNQSFVMLVSEFGK